ncbi:MAG: hypothetical protein KC619_29605 [Myxococcales bacterium]|nr:hypothetical protein [Myxococcales bacterium]
MRSFTLFASSLLALTACGSSHGVDAGGPESNYGDPCGPDMPCGGGLACVENELYPGGYCTSTCAGDTDCGAGATCDTSTDPRVCLADCATSADCRDGYQCWRGSCRPLCRGDSDCGGDLATCGTDGTCAGAECVVDGDCGAMQMCRAGACVERPPVPDAGPGGSPHGTPCARDDECEGGICLPAELGGVCSLACTQPEDCFVFPTEGGCSALAEPGAPTVCVVSAPGAVGVGASCTSDDDCLARICQDGQCSEVCSDVAQCVPGTQCVELTREGAGGSTFQGCGYPDFAGRSNTYLVNYGRFDIQAGFAEMVQLATPPDAISVTLQARQISGPAHDVSFLSIQDPDGLALFDVGQIVMLVDQPIRWLPSETFDSATVLVPNTTPDRVTFVPGIHRWSVGPIPTGPGDTTMPRYELSALVKRAPGGSFTSGRVDLDVWIVGIAGLSTANASTHTKLQGALSRLDAILAPTGISVGDVRYHDITGADASRYQVIDSADGIDSELAELFRLSSAGGRRLNVFLVRSISIGGSGFRALGIAGGISGPVGIPGTGHSGVCVSFDDGVVGSGATGARVVGQILSHEMGHYVGLFHSTEQARPCGPGEDPSTVDCAPFGGGDQLADTTRGDTTNLMYWSIVGSGTNTDLTAGQGHVYRMSALTR